MRRPILQIAAGAMFASTASAQSILDSGLRAGPQYVQYEIAGSAGQRISELAVPIFALVPVTPRFSVDVGTAFASARVESTSGSSPASTISGFTDTQLRASYTFGSDFVVLTGGLNLPTGRSTATLEELSAASLIGSDFLAFPVTNMGTGFGATGGLAVARQAGSWNLGGGASVRRSSPYDAVDDPTSGARMRYQPGNEYRARVGADRLVGNGRLTLGLTFSTFGHDLIDGSIYNTADRWITQASYEGGVGPGALTVAVFGLARGGSTRPDGSSSGRDEITNAFVAYGMRAGRSLVEPSVEVRNWFAQGMSASSFVSFGLRSVWAVGPLSISPSARYGMGALADGASTVRLTGWHGVLSLGVAR